MSEGKKASGAWSRFLRIYSLLFLLLGAILWLVLYAYAAAYERSLPEHVMEKLMEETGEEEWEAYACLDAPFAASRFEDGEALLRGYYRAAVAGQELSWRKAPQFAAEAPCYEVRGGGLPLCRVTLSPQEGAGAGFGRPLWQVSGIVSCFAPEGLERVTLEVDAPDDRPLWLNGVLLGEEERTAPPEDTTDAAWIRYRVEGLRGEVRVTEADGTVLTPVVIGDALLRCRAEPKELYAVSVRAPEGVTVTVNGRSLSPEEGEADPGILKGLEKTLGDDAYETLTYRREDLVAPPAVTGVTAEGTELTPLVTPSGCFVFFYPQEEDVAAWAEPVADAFFTRYMAYSSGAWSAGRHQALLNSILPGTELDSYVRGSRAAMIWASKTKVSYEELRFEDFVLVGENCFTCTVRYKGDFSARAWYESYSYEMENAYELAFIREGNRWLAAAMSVLP